MLRLVADEDFNGRILRGLLLRNHDMDVVRVQDIGLSGAGDEKLLEWASDNARVLLTHDAQTMPRHLLDHLKAGLHVPGVLIVDDLAPIGRVIEDLLLIAECSEPTEWQDQVLYVPLR